MYSQPKQNWTLLLAGSLLAILACGGTSPAQDGAPAEAPPESSEKSRMPSEDRILNRIHLVNQLNIRAGELARQKGTTLEIRSFGSRLVRDHTAADQRVKRYAVAHNITLLGPDKFAEAAEEHPSDLVTPRHRRIQQRMQEVVEKLPTLEGPAFDREFLTIMERGHEMAVSSFRSAQDRLPGDSQLRELIAQLLPVLTNHYVTASRLALKMGPRQPAPGENSLK